VKSKLFLSLLFGLFFVSPIYAVRILPPGMQPKSLEGEAVGTFPELKGSGTLTFTNIGGEARLVTVCDTPTSDNVTCNGIDVTGTFTGGPDGTAVFKTASGEEIKLQLSNGKIFSFSARGLSMNFAVTDPSIFDAWVENAGARDSGARISDLSGQVEIACPPDLEAWDVMKMGRVIYVDCHLKTGEDSNAVISFSDMTTFTMKSESEIVIDTPPEKESKLSLLAGNIWVNVKQMVKDGTMKVHMSQAVAGIKGTTFVLNETKTESVIKVIDGVVNFQSIATNDEVNVKAGESVKATSVGLSEKTNFDISQEQSNWTEKNEPIEKKLFETNNQKIIYLAIASVIALLVIVIGAVVLRKRK
jgi:hypothetical protein